MYRALVVVSVAGAAAGCGFGFGAVEGVSREHTIMTPGDWYQDSSGTHVDRSGQRWRQGAVFSGYATPSAGVMLGFRRGLAWTRYGEKIEGGRTADYHLTGYYGPFAVALGYTSETGRITIPYTISMPLPADVGYHGWYVEPTLALLARGPFYVGATFALIDGSTTLKLDNRSTTGEAEAFGMRPGLRFALSVLPVGPVTLKLSADIRYLLTPETTLITGGDTTGASYGGLSTAVSLSFVL